MDHLISRRSILAAGGAAILTATAAARAAAPFFERKRLPLGVQLYALGEELTSDFDGTLAKVARIGYRRVELAGFNGRTARALRAAFDRAGLECRSAHIPLTAVFPGQGPTLADPEKLIEDAHILGLQFVVMPMFPFPAAAGKLAAGENFMPYVERAGGLMTVDDWKATADLLNRFGARIAKAGLRMAYHNHNFEFAPKGGSEGYQILMEQTDPKLVSFEMDAGWVAAAGLDPIALLKRYPGRFRLMHVKDIKASTRPNFVMQQDPTEVGSGTIDWPRLLPAAYAAGIRDFYVEQEPPFTGSRIAAIETSYHYLNRLRV